MRIGIVVDSLNVGGAERQALYSARELARLGCGVELIHYRPILEGYELPDMCGARVSRLAWRGGRAGMVAALRRRIRENGCDIVQGFKGVPSIYAGLAGLLAPAPVVLGSYRSPYCGRGITRAAHRWLTRRIDGWVVNSQAIKRSMMAALDAPAAKFEVVYNGMDFAAFTSTLSRAEARCRLGLRPDQPTVAMVAGLRPEKNHRLFFDSAACLLKRCSGAHFIVAGNGPLRSELERYVSSLGISSHVSFLGARGDIGDILAATDVSVLTSDYEGLSNVLIESMSAGVPVISSAYDGVEELLTDGAEGFVVPRDSCAIADRIAKLIEKPCLREQMGFQGRRVAEARFGLETMGKSLIELYERHLRTSRRGRR